MRQESALKIQQVHPGTVPHYVPVIPRPALHRHHRQSEHSMMHYDAGHGTVCISSGHVHWEADRKCCIFLLLPDILPLSFPEVSLESSARSWSFRIRAPRPSAYCVLLPQPEQPLLSAHPVL